MNKKRAIFILLTIFILVTFVLSFVQTKQFSAYAACRNVAIETKGYAVWEHQSTIPFVFLSRITFSDGINNLDCNAMGIMSFWAVTSHSKTNAFCGTNLSETPNPCLEDYFGVKP